MREENHKDEKWLNTNLYCIKLHARTEHQT